MRKRRVINRPHQRQHSPEDPKIRNWQNNQLIGKRIAFSWPTTLTVAAPLVLGGLTTCRQVNDPGSMNTKWPDCTATAAFTVVDGAFGGVDVGGRLGGAKIFWGTPRGSISTGEHPR